MSVQTILTYTEIDREAWSRLVQTSRTGTWFQTPEAYDFYASQPELFEPLVVGISNLGFLISASLERSAKAVQIANFKFEDTNLGKASNDRQSCANLELRGVCVGYVTKERSRLKQFFTGRAIIPGGPCLADDATEEEVEELMSAVTGYGLRVTGKPIYIETRNFNDYSRWRSAFEAAGFSYQPHLNFHVDCTDKQKMWERLSDNRKRQVRRGFSNLGFKISNLALLERSASRANFKFEDCYLDSLERSAQSRADLGCQISDFKFLDDIVTEDDVREWYGILQELYRTKVKTPLWPVEFFVQAYKQGVGQFILIRHEGKIIGGSFCVVLRRDKFEIINSKSEITTPNVVYEWYECGMNAEYKEQYPSVMATWAGMLYAHEQGCARYDMMGAGVPGVPYGVRDFKAEFGGTMVEHGRWLYIAKPLLYTIGKAGVRLLKSAH